MDHNEKLTNLYTEKWIEFLLESITLKEVEEKWLPQSKAEDFPAPIIGSSEMVRRNWI